jgi:hypothetical protein
MRTIAILAAATAVLTAAGALPALANDYCHSGDPLVQSASNNGSDVNNAGQHINQGQFGDRVQIGHPNYVYYNHQWHYVGSTYSTIQKQTADNEKVYSNGGDQSIGQLQIGFLGSECGPAQDQYAKNWTDGNNNNQHIWQFQAALEFYADGNAQHQSAHNSADDTHDNNQTIGQSQVLLTFFSDGTAQDQHADNNVNNGHDNTQTITQSQSLVAGSTNGTVESQSASNSVSDGHGNTQTIHQTQGGIVNGGPVGGPL